MNPSPLLAALITERREVHTFLPDSKSIRLHARKCATWSGVTLGETIQCSVLILKLQPRINGRQRRPPKLRFGHANASAKQLRRSPWSESNLLWTNTDIHGAHQPRNNHLLEDGWIAPDLNLPAKVAALGIDPRIFGNVTIVEKQVDVRYWNLRIQDSSNDQHRSHRLPQKILIHERHPGQERCHFV